MYFKNVNFEVPSFQKHRGCQSNCTNCDIVVEVLRFFFLNFIFNRYIEFNYAKENKHYSGRVQYVL